MKIKPFAQISLAALLLSTLQSPFTICHAQGTLTPPGPPAPLMKSLDQIEPRTPISGQVILTNSGSYYLTTNIIANSGYGILVQADNVSIDLYGFTLDGGPGASAVGILVNTPHTNFTVYNGAIRHWGSTGIDASSGIGNRFESLKILYNKGAGLLSGTPSQVRGCSVTFNNGDGMVLGPNSAVIDSMVIGNNGRGIVVQDNSSIKNSSVNANTNGGIFTGLNCLVSQCLVISNINHTGDGSLGNGIVVSNDSSVAECVVNYNSGNAITMGADCTARECTIFHNPETGILFLDNCRVVDNNCGYNGNGSGNTAAIYALGSGNRIDGNNVYSNTAPGIRTAFITGNPPANLVVRNNSRGNSPNYFRPGTNYFGPIVQISDGVDGLSGIITNSNPWANFSN